MNNHPPPRRMFPESRFILGLLSPILGAFFGLCFYFTDSWQAATLGDKIGKFAMEDVLFTFISLCGVGIIASVVGPDRIRPLIIRIGGKAAISGLAVMVGTIAYILFYCWMYP